MALTTWTDGETEMYYSYDDQEPSIKDKIRGLIGDINGIPVAYLSDSSITSTATLHGNDLYVAAAECAGKAAARCLSIHQEVQQGSSRHGLRIKNFDPQKAFETFTLLADTLRNKSTQPSVPNYGAIGGAVKNGWCG